MMLIISELSALMDEEVKDAYERVMLAIKYKSDHPEIAKRHYDTAVQELAHADKDHLSAVELITAAKRGDAEIPKFMQEYWDERHKEYVTEYGKVKAIIDNYNKLS